MDGQGLSSIGRVKRRSLPSRSCNNIIVDQEIESMAYGSKNTIVSIPLPWLRLQTLVFASATIFAPAISAGANKTGPVNDSAFWS